VFGFTLFYFYIFIRKNLLGRKAGYQSNSSECWCFPQGEKNSAPTDYIRRDDVCRPFFYVLSRLSPAIKMGRFELALKTGC